MAFLRAVLALLLLTAAAAAQAQSAGPRAIMQGIGSGGIEVAAWSPDERYIVTANGIDRLVSIIDTRNGQVVDRAVIPSQLSPDGMDCLVLNGATFSPDGRRVTFHGLAGHMLVDTPAESREIVFDMVTRRFSLGKPVPVPDGTMGIAGYYDRIGAIKAFYVSGTAANFKPLPALPSSPKRGLRLMRTREGLTLAAANGTQARIALPRAMGFSGGALSPDGRLLVLIDGDTEDDPEDKLETKIRRYDITTGNFLPLLTVADQYGMVAWVDDNHFLLTEGSGDGDRDPDEDSTTGPISPALVVDATTGQVVRRIEGRCFIQPLPNGGLIGAGAANCRADPKLDRRVQRFDPVKGRWMPIPVEELGNSFVNGLTVSPDGKLVAINAANDDGGSRLLLSDIATGNQVSQLVVTVADNQPGTITGPPAFSEDSQKLYVPATGSATVLDVMRAGTTRNVELTTSLPEMVLVHEGVLYASSTIDNRIERADVRTGKALAAIEFGNVSNGGFIKGRPVFWAVSYTGGIRLWDTRTWQPILTTYIFPKSTTANAYLAVTPDGRYDTNIPVEESPYRWIVDDAPFQSLAPQTFMRDYFTPRLVQKLFDCTGAGNCASVLPRLNSFATLNRTLPEVRIDNVTEPDEQGFVTVTVKVAEGLDPQAPPARSRSGIYGLRLFMDGRLVEQFPRPDYQAIAVGMPLAVEDVPQAMNADISVWRKLNEIRPENGTSVDFRVRLPTWFKGERKVEFSAYAFNADRVKGETDSTPYAVPASLQPRPRRAFVIGIGVSDYNVEPRLHLDYAAKDPALLAQRLAGLFGYEVRYVPLATQSARAGAERLITSQDIGTVLVALTGGPLLADVNQRLNRVGIDRAIFADPLTPDDAVIIAYSGHGWADPAGNFYFLASDTKWPGNTSAPVVETTFSSTMLQFLLDRLPASEIAIIIDACHSAASVANDNFKPGPMGDSSLGQLAYDKKLRIIAATQSDDVAKEASALGHGLLTWTLAGLGLDPKTGAADFDRNGLVTIDEWFRFAQQRLPALSEEVQSGADSGSDEDDGLVFVSRTRAKPKPQLPALFDFNRDASRVAVMRR